MSTKELAIETIRNLPDSTSWREIEDRIHFLAAIDKARDEIRGNEFIPHEEVRDRLEQWISA